MFLSLPALVNKALELAGATGLDIADVASLRGVAHKQLLQQWASFQRRIKRPLRESQGCSLHTVCMHSVVTVTNDIHILI